MASSVLAEWMTKNCGFIQLHCSACLLRTSRTGQCSVHDSDSRRSRSSNAGAVRWQSYFDIRKKRWRTTQAKTSGKRSARVEAQLSSLRRRKCFKYISAAAKNCSRGIYFFVSKRPFLIIKIKKSGLIKLDKRK